MVPRLGPREGQHRRREEHGLVVRVRDEQADALVAQLGEARLDHRDGVQVQAGQHDRDDSKGYEPVHFVLIKSRLLGSVRVACVGALFWRGGFGQGGIWDDSGRWIRVAVEGAMAFEEASWKMLRN